MLVLAPGAPRQGWVAGSLRRSRVGRLVGVCPLVPICPWFAVCRGVRVRWGVGGVGGVGGLLGHAVTPRGAAGAIPLTIAPLPRRRAVPPGRHRAAARVTDTRT